MKYETQAIHGGIRNDGEIVGANMPIHLSSTFIQPNLKDFKDFVYSRGNNPTRYYLETLVAQLEGAKYALALASGMAATSLVFGLFKSGDKILFNSNVYGGTYRYISNVFQDRGLEYEIIGDFNEYSFEHLTDNVKAIFIETPSNPLLDVTDIRRLSKIAKEKNILLIVDNTFLTSYFQKPLELGADIVVYSATKYYSGHSDVIAGLVVVDNDELFEQLKFLQNTFGGILSPQDCFLLARGIKTLPLRLNKHQENTMKLTNYLEKNKAIKKVNYPGLKSHKNYDIQRAQASGDGAVFSILLNDNYDLDVFVESLQIFALAVSLGGVESLVCHPSSMTHEAYPIELQQEIGIEVGLLRFAVGIENIDDLIEDIQQALKKAKRGK